MEPRFFHFVTGENARATSLTYYGNTIAMRKWTCETKCNQYIYELFSIINLDYFQLVT